MVFTTNRALHSRGVSILMKRLTPIMNVELHRNGVKSRLDADEMALVGWVHDFGYLLDEDPDAHASVMGRLMDTLTSPSFGLYFKTRQTSSTTNQVIAEI